MLCFVASAMIVSCNKDTNEDNGNSDNNTSIVGTWGCVNSYEHYWGMRWNDNYTEIIPYDIEYTDFWKGDVINLKDDGTYTSSDDVAFFDDHGGMFDWSGKYEPFVYGFLQKTLCDLLSEWNEMVGGVSDHLRREFSEDGDTIDLWLYCLCEVCS